MADVYEFFHDGGRNGVGESLTEAVEQVMGSDIKWDKLQVAPGNINRLTEGEIFFGEEKIGYFTML